MTILRSTFPRPFGRDREATVPETVERAADAAATAVEDVGVDHGGLDVFVAEELLYGADIVAALE